MRSALVVLLTLGCVVVCWLAPAAAWASSLGKSELTAIRIDQRLGEQVPMEHAFMSAGREVTLRELGAGKPIVLALVYNRCPMLCNQVLQGLIGTLKVVDLDPGEDFAVVAVSFDPEEDEALTRDVRSTFLRRWGRADAAAGVHFLTGEAPAIEALTDAVGFRYQYDELSKEYAHPSGLVVLTPEGRVARYFFGSEFSPRDMRLALREASNGEVGSITDELLLLCYQYDPQSGTYSASVVNAIRAGGVATLLALVWFIGRSVRRERRRPEAPARRSEEVSP